MPELQSRRPRPAEDFWDGAPPLRRPSHNPKSPITRRSARNSFTLFLLLLLLLASPRTEAAEPTNPALNQLTPEQIADGWISLFDGETLFGWTATSDANWKVEDGAITVSDGEEGFLATNAEFADYELHVEFKAPATTNSGVFLRTPLKPTDPTKDCIELNIAPWENPFPTGSLVGRIRHPVAEGALNPPPSQGGARGGIPDVPRPAGDGPQWRSLSVTLRRETITVRLDHALLYTQVLQLPTAGDRRTLPTDRGRISLQFREGPVAFRNIRLKPLGLKPMLNGKDLTGWNTDKAEASEFEVTPAGELHVTNGRGQLETNASYGDFVMQLDCRVDGDGLNSGVFYRCIPREFMNGYECQIHNVFKDGDPTKPADFGTGGIYRRVPARRVVSRDHEWFTMTLVPTGQHVSVWVNGYQVTDWTDERPPHKNPRNGLRTAPGTIAIQGHDPTTDLRFRNLRIVELPENDEARMTNDE